MKLPILATLIALSSCASYAPKTYKQQCANKGMMLKGVNESSGSTSNYNYYTGWTSGGFSGENVSCEVPKTLVEKCQVQGYQDSAGPIDNYNSGYNMKYFLSGLGYYAFIVPGIVAKVVFDNQKDQAINESLEKHGKVEGVCSHAEAREPANQAQE